MPRNTLSPVWQEYRRRRRLVGILILAWPPVFYAVSRGLQQVGQREGGSALGALFAMFAIWVAAIIVAGMRWQWFRCPRCGRPFHRRGLFGNVFSRRCLNCGLRKWEDPAEVSGRA